MWLVDFKDDSTFKGQTVTRLSIECNLFFRFILSIFTKFNQLKDRFTKCAASSSTQIQCDGGDFLCFFFFVVFILLTRKKRNKGIDESENLIASLVERNSNFARTADDSRHRSTQRRKLQCNHPFYMYERNE